MRKIAAACVVSLGLALGGCASSIKVAKLGEEKAPTGVPWNLAMTQYKVTVTRQVTSCANYLNGTATITAVASKKLDKDQQYFLHSDGVWATADITSTLAGDGTSLGLNAKSEDQTGAVITNTVGLLSAVATGAALAPAAGRFTCSDEVQKALDELKPASGDPLKQQVDAATRNVASATAKVTALTPLYANLKDKPSPEETALGKATQDLIEKQETLNVLQAKLTRHLKTVTTTQTFMWPPTSDVAATKTAFALDPQVAQSWVKWKDLPEGQTQAEISTTAFDVHLALYKEDDKGGWAVPTEKPATGDTQVGVPIRLARLGRLLACGKTACPATLAANWVAADGQTLLVEPDAPVLQFGQLYNVPMTGGTFRSSGAVIALDANGVPTSIQVSEKQAAAATATATARDAVTGLTAIPGKIAAARLAQTQGTTAQVNADSALAAAQESARYGSLTAGATAQSGYLSALNTLATAQANRATSGETATATAQTAYLNAVGALATARANAEAAGEVGQLAAQNAIAKQQVELASQTSALATSRAKASVAAAIDTMGANTSLVNAQTAAINAEVALAKAGVEMTKVQ